MVDQNNNIKLNIKDDNELMYGWLICKLDGTLIHSILYGQFTSSLLPPSNNWIFLARDSKNNITSEDHSITSIDYTKYGIHI